MDDDIDDFLYGDDAPAVDGDGGVVAGDTPMTLNEAAEGVDSAKVQGDKEAVKDKEEPVTANDLDDDDEASEDSDDVRASRGGTLVTLPTTLDLVLTVCVFIGRRPNHHWEFRRSSPCARGAIPTAKCGLCISSEAHRGISRRNCSSSSFRDDSHSRINGCQELCGHQCSWDI